MITISQGRLFRMPAGEWHISPSSDSDALVKPFGRLTARAGPLVDSQVAFVQGASANDLVALAIWADAVHRDGGVPTAIIPYLPGARQDRRRPGEALSAKVYADLINSCGFAKVICVDPHSDVMPALINNCVIVDIDELWRHLGLVEEFSKYDGFIIPDGGAGKRVGKVSQLCGVPTFQAVKHRSLETGQLSGFGCEELPVAPDHEKQPRFLLVDDICDAGGTFMGLAKVLLEEQGVGPDQLDIWVTHGIFSGNRAEKMADFFGKIFCTDSYEPFAATARYEIKFERKVRRMELFGMLREYV